MTKRADAKPKTQVRCAIYTRKSTEEGLEQEFNSLDAQRESAEAYIASQKGEGWVALPDRYDDGGFTGGNMERPAVRRLMADIEAGRVDCVVVYKVDRLSRSLIDFARMMEVFERKKISFVSVTQQFNTTQSMGRLTLNILLSFAQFEREIISDLPPVSMPESMRVRVPLHAAAGTAGAQRRAARRRRWRPSESSSPAPAAGSYLTVATLVAKFTLADETPGCLASRFSIWFAHEAHVMPSIGRSQRSSGVDNVREASSPCACAGVAWRFSVLMCFVLDDRS